MESSCCTVLHPKSRNAQRGAPSCLVLTFVRILPLARSKKRKICTGGCTVVVASKRHEEEPHQRRR
eukprot:494822-Rhodomonas_salina.1